MFVAGRAARGWGPGWGDPCFCRVGFCVVGGSFGALAVILLGKLNLACDCVKIYGIMQASLYR